MISTFFNELFKIINDASFYLLLGFLLAGIIHEFISSKSLAKHLGGKNLKSIFKASLIGIPLPLCSCGVIPTAILLRKDGASKESTVSFLIATPETGVDSISISYALLDPLLTIFRPISALITSVSAGVMEMLFGEKKSNNSIEKIDRCSCEDECEEDSKPQKSKTFSQKLKDSFRYGFFVFFGDIVWYIVFGFLIASLISTLIPESWIINNLQGKGIFPMLLMTAIGVPLYICSTSATPIASSLILKGASPGAALVLLLTGPATNISTIIAVGKFLGKRSLFLYLSSIVVLSLFLGLVINWIYFTLGINAQATLGKGAELVPEKLKLISSFVFIFFILFLLTRRLLPKKH